VRQSRREEHKRCCRLHQAHNYCRRFKRVVDDSQNEHPDVVLGDENKKTRQVQEEQPDEAVVLKKKEKKDTTGGRK